MVPELFTPSPMEASVIEVGLRAQGAVAGLIANNPVFLGFGLMICIYVFGRQMWRMGTGQAHALQAAWIAGRTFFLFLFAMSMIGWSSTEPIYIGSSDAPDRAWADYSGVVATDAYEGVAYPENEPLQAYRFVNGSIEWLSVALYEAIGARLDADTQNPTRMIADLERFRQTSLGPEHAELVEAFDHWASRCAHREGVMFQVGTTLRSLWDAGDTMTDPECDERRDEIIQRIPEATEILVDRMQQAGSAGVSPSTDEVSSALLLGLGHSLGIGEAQVPEAAMAVALENLLVEHNRTAFGLRNDNAREDATFSDNFGDSFRQTLARGITGEGMIAIQHVLGIEHAEQKQRKAMMANLFYKYADLIPTMRGFLHALFAVGFPLCVYAFGLGWWRPMMAWCSGRLMLAMYLPASTLLFKMTDYFTKMSGIDMGQLDWSDIGLASALQEEVIRLQTVYIVCEVATFMTFVVGSIGLMRGGLAVVSHMGATAEDAVTSMAWRHGGAQVHRYATRAAVVKGAAAAGTAAGAMAGGVGVAARAGVTVVQGATSLARAGAAGTPTPSAGPAAVPLAGLQRMPGKSETPAVGLKVADIGPLPGGKKA